MTREETHGNGYTSSIKCPHAEKHIPESQGGWNEGSTTGGIGVKWLKTQPLVYRWMSGAGWATLTSYEAVRVKAVNHKPMNCPKEPSQGGE